MNFSVFSSSRGRGFTLIEILVIAALISLFSALAIFSMTYLVDSSKRKSVIADTSTIGKTLGMVHMDFGFFPKIGYLSLPVERIRQPGGALSPGFDTLGFDTLQPQSRKIIADWKGPYLPSPVPRQAVSPGFKGYTTKVRVPGSPPIRLDWPADPWGNPYVVYLIHLGPGDTATPRWINSPMEKANYLAIVVSYGKNRIPGGFPDTRLAPAQQAVADSLRLFRVVDDPAAEFETLIPAQYTTQMLLPLHNAQGWQQEGFGGSYLADPSIPGILDSGSDDIVHWIP